MSKLRLLARRAMLGWLAAEWLGVLVAYGFAVVSFAFLIAYFVLEIEPQLLVLVPVAVLLAAGGLLLARAAYGVPRELYALAVQSDSSVPAPADVPRPAPMAAPLFASPWSADPVILRVGTLMALDTARADTRSGAVAVPRSSDDRWTSDSVSFHFRRGTSSWDSRLYRGDRIPSLRAGPPSVSDPIRIVDLSERR